MPSRISNRLDALERNGSGTDAALAAASRHYLRESNETLRISLNQSFPSDSQRPCREPTGDDLADEDESVAYMVEYLKRHSSQDFATARQYAHQKFMAVAGRQAALDAKLAAFVRSAMTGGKA